MRNGQYMQTWDYTVERINELNDMIMDWEMPELFIAIPKVLYRGPYKPELAMQLEFNPNLSEGWVMSNVDNFHIDQYERNVIKFVREGHVQTDEHWAHKEIQYNEIRYPSLPA